MIGRIDKIDGVKRPLWWKQRRWIASRQLDRQIRKGKKPRGRTPTSEGGVQEGDASFTAQLFAKHIKADGSEVDLGLISERVVTTAFVNYLVDSLQDSTTYPMEAFSWHDAGTGVTGPVVGDTGMETPWGGSRVDGSQGENAANIYETIATIPFTGTFAITEHGVFSASTSGTLCDRSTFAAINVINGDSIQFTYRLTCTAGG